MHLPKITLNFINKYHIYLTEENIQFGISRRLFNDKDLSKIIDYALVNNIDSTYLLDSALRIQKIGYESFLQTIPQYIDRENGVILSRNEKLDKKWQYVVLLWLFEHGQLNSIDSIYAEFGYPEDIRDLVSYMPDTAIHNLESDWPPLEKWTKYLDDFRYLLQEKF